MAVDRVLLAAPRGFCAGVEMAIKALAWMVRVFEPPVYCFHEIVHNQLVVDRFRRLGVVFVDDVADVPDGRAPHAERPRVGPRGGGRGPGPGGRVRGRRRVPPGHQGPPRGQGAGGQGLLDRLRRPRGPRRGGGHHGRGPVVDPPGGVRADVAALPDPGGPVALLAQTTLSHHDWADVLEATRQRFPDLWMPSRSDLCFATTNRQSALTEIARTADAIVVIGSANSSNTVALAKVATRRRLPPGLPGEPGRRAARRPHRRGRA